MLKIVTFYYFSIHILITYKFIAMSTGGSIAAMVESMKNNKRSRKSVFKKLEDHGNYTSKTKLQFKKTASKCQLRKIRNQLKEENRKSFRKKIVLLLIMLAAAIYLIGFASF